MQTNIQIDQSSAGFSASGCSAVFERIIKLCEAYDNQDIEGQDPEDVMEAADLVVHQICEIACVEHALLSHHTSQLIDAPATCNKCHAQHISPTTGKVWSKCYCGGDLTPQNDQAHPTAAKTVVDGTENI